MIINLIPSRNVLLKNQYGRTGHQSSVTGTGEMALAYPNGFPLARFQDVSAIR